MYQGGVVIANWYISSIS